MTRRLTRTAALFAVGLLAGVSPARALVCAVTKVVKQAGGGDCATIQACVNLIPATLTGNFCVDIQDSATYSEAVTVQGVDPSTAGFQISIGPLNTANRPSITQPGPVNGPFITVMNSSVTLHDLNVSGSGAALISISSPSSTLDGVIADAEGMVPANGAAIVISSRSLVIRSSITVNADGGGSAAVGLRVTGTLSLVSLSTVTGSGSQVTDLVEIGGTSNTVTNSRVANATCYGVSIGNEGPSVSSNTVSFSTITGAGASCAGLHFAAGSYNTISDSYLFNPSGIALLIDTIGGSDAYNTISRTSVVSASAGGIALSISGSGPIILSGSSVRGSSAVYVSAGAGLMVSSSALSATSAAGFGLALLGSSPANLSSVTFSGGGLKWDGGSTVSLTSVTFQGLTAGATAVALTANATYVATFTSVNFADPNIAVNIDGSLVDAAFTGSRVTLRAPAGPRAGPGFEDDPSGFIDWPESLAAGLPAGCGAGYNVKKDGSQNFAGIQAALNALNPVLAADTCVVIRDTQTYQEAVSVQGFAANGYRLRIMADPSFVSSAPAVNPPGGTAAFLIASASTSLSGIDVVPTSAISYGVLVSSPYVSISSVNVKDAGGRIASAGISLSNWATVSRSSVTAWGANASAFYFPGAGWTSVSDSSAAANSSNGYAMYLNGASTNTIQRSFATNPNGSAIYVAPASNGNTVAQSRMTSGVSGYYGLIVQSASTNTFSQDYIGNTSGDGAYLTSSNYNTISQTTMTVNAASFWGLWLSASSTNTIIQSYVYNASNNGVHLQNASFNSISQSTMATTCFLCAGVDFQSASYNSITQSAMTSLWGSAASLDAASHDNTLSLSTMTSPSPYTPALFVAGANDSFVSDYIQGSTAAIVSGSTGAAISASVLVATNTTGSALLAELGASGLSVTGSGLAAASSGVGLNLASVSGGVTVETNTVTGAAWGMAVGAPSAGAALSVTSMTFVGLTPGATAVQLMGGVFVATFTTMNFDPSVDVNINASLLSAGSAVTMVSVAGLRLGPTYADDPGQYVYWKNFNYPGCALTENVGSGQSYVTIQSAVNTLPNPMSGFACIVIRDGATYNEQVTVQGFAMNGSSVAIFADPASGLRPVINPPPGAVAGFVIADSSVIVSGFGVIPTNAMSYGVLVSSPGVFLSSISILDLGGKISQYGLAFTSWTTVSKSSVVVTASTGIYTSGIGSVVSQSTASTSRNGASALWLDGASSNTVTQNSFFGQGSARGVMISSGGSNMVSASTFTTTGACSLEAYAASGNTFSRDYFNTGPACLTWGSSANTISQSTMSTDSAPEALLIRSNSSANLVVQSYIVSQATRAVVLASGAHDNVIRQSSITVNASAAALWFGGVGVGGAANNVVTQSWISNAISSAVYMTEGSLTTNNTISLSTITSNGAPAAVYMNGVASNTVTDDVVMNRGTGSAMELDGGATFNTIMRSSITNSGSGSAALVVIGASSNTVAQSSIGNPIAGGVILSGGANSNTILQSTVTAGGASSWALALVNSSSNTINLSSLIALAGGGLSLSGATHNTIVQSTVKSNSNGNTSLIGTNSFGNTITQSVLSNSLGHAVQIGASPSDNSSANAISQSTITSTSSGDPGLFLWGGSSNTISGDYIQGSTAVYVASSTGALIDNDTLVASTPTGSALLAEYATNLTLSNSNLTATPTGVGVMLSTGTQGQVYLATVTVTGARYGLLVGAPAAGAGLSSLALNFSGLAAGATAVEFLGGTPVSTFTLTVFDASIGANVDASALSAGASLTMFAASGARAGAKYADDPNGYVHWTSSNTAYPGCPLVANVNQTAGPYNNIAAALASLPSTLTVPACVVVRDGATYVEQVTVQGFTASGATLSLFADPASGQRPVVSPPAGSTAAFAVASASVSVTGFGVVPIGAMTYGVLATSASVTFSSMAVSDAGGLISGSGVSLAGAADVLSYSTVAVAGPGAAGVSASGAGAAVAYASATSLGASALVLTGASETVTQSYFAGPAGAAALNGTYAIVSRSLFTSTASVPALSISGAFNTVTQSTASASGAAAAAASLIGSSNVLTSDLLSATSGYGLFINPNSNGASVSLSTIASSAGPYAALSIVGASSNSVTRSYLSAPGSFAVLLDTAANSNTIALSTASTVLGRAALFLRAASSNTISGSVLSDPAGSAALLDANSAGNAIVQSALTGGAAGYAALHFAGASSNTAVQDSVSNAAGPAARLDSAAFGNLVAAGTLRAGAGTYALGLFGAASGNTVSLSTVVMAASGSYGVYVQQASSNAFSGDYVQGSTAVYVSASTATAIAGAALAATGTGASALAADGGSNGLSLIASSLSAAPSGTGVTLAAGDGGTLNLTTVTISGSRYGAVISTPAAGAWLTVASMTFTGLSAGATALQFTGGVVVSTLTTVSFDPSVAVNVSASALSTGSSLTMMLPTGARSGPAHADDPWHYIQWLASSSFAGCAVTENVGSGWPYSSIQSGVSALPLSLPPGKACVVVEDGGTYAEQVTLRNFTLNGSSIAIFADPASGLTPSLSPPSGSTAAFVIANASVSVTGINVAPSAPVSYGLLVSSPSAAISSVSVLDPGGFIGAAGVSLAGGATLTRSFVSIKSAVGVSVSGSFNTVSFSTMASGGSGVPALKLAGASSSTIASDYIANTAAYGGASGPGALLISGGAGNAVSFATVAANGVSLAGVSLQGASFNTVAASVISNAAGVGLRDSGGLGNAYSSVTVSGAGGGAMFLDGASSDVVVGSVLSASSGIGLQIANSAAYNSVSWSTMTGGGSPGLEISGASSNTVTQSVVNGGVGVEGGSAYTAISFSTLTSVLLGANLTASGASTTTLVNCTVSGAPALSVAGSTGTVLTADSLTATSPSVPALSFGGGSVNLSASSNTIIGGALGAAVALGGVSGSISLAGGFVSGAAVGVSIAVQAPGTLLVLSGLTFSSLTSGATAVQFAGGTFVSTFTSLSFYGPGLAVNVDASALSNGSSLTMSAAFGNRSGPTFADDPGGFIHWPASIPPVTRITSPSLQMLNSIAAVAGTAQSFSGTTLSSVFVSVQNLGGGQYWNGSAFVLSSKPIYNAAALSTQTPTAAGSSASWSYPGALLTGALTNGTSYQIQSLAMDSYTQLQTFVSTFVFTFDITPPSISFQAPVPGAVYSSLPTISGTSSDQVGVATVTISVRQLPAGACFNPAQGGFFSVCPSPFPARGTPTAWSFAAIPWTGGQYQIAVTAINSINNVAVSSASFTFAVSTGLSAGAVGDGGGSAALVPASVAGCQLMSATATYTAGPSGLATGGAIAMRVPAGWTQPQGSAPGQPGYVQIVSTGGFDAQFNPPALGAATLGTNWILYVATTPVTPGQTVRFVYQGYPAQGSSAQGPQVFAFASRGAGNGQLVALSSSPAIGVAPGAPAQMSFSPSTALTLGRGQNSPQMQVALRDSCGVPTVQTGGPLTVALEADIGSSIDPNGAFFWTGGGGAVVSVPIAAGSSLSAPFYFTTTSPPGPESLSASAPLAGGQVAVARPATIQASSASLSSVSVDTGTPGSAVSVAIVQNGTSASAAYINFTPSDPSLTWEAIVSTDPVAFYPKLADFTGVGSPGRALLWSGLDARSNPPRFVSPGTYYVEIVAGGGSAVDSSLSVVVLPGPTIFGQAANAPGAKVVALGPDAVSGSYAIASSTGFFRISGLREGTTYFIQASSVVSTPGGSVTRTAGIGGLLATSAGTNAGRMSFPTLSLLELSATLPYPAPADVSGTISVRDASSALAGAGTIHFFSGGTGSDNGARAFGADASSWTTVAVPPGTYTVDVAVPALGLSLSAPNVIVGAGAPTYQALALSKLVNAYGLAVLPAAAAGNTWVSVSASGPGGATAYGGVTVPAGAASAVYSLFGLTSGAWTVTASAPGVSPASTSVFVIGSADIGSPATGGLDLRLKSAGVLSGTLTVVGDTSQSAMSACAGGAALCVPVSASNPSSFFTGGVSVTLATSAASTSGAFSIPGAPDGSYTVAAALTGFTGPPSTATVSSGVGSTALTLTANSSRVQVVVSLSGVHPASDFKNVSLGLAGSRGGALAFPDMTAGTTIQYYASSAAVLLSGLDADVYRFSAFDSARGMARSVSASLASDAAAAVVLDLSGTTYSVGGAVSLGTGLNLPSSSGLSVSVSSVPGLLSNVSTMSYCLLGLPAPATISAAHMELLPVPPGGTALSAPLTTTADVCPANMVSPVSASGPLTPNPYAAYIATFGVNGGFLFPSVPAGVYVLRNNAVLDSAGDRIPQFSRVVVVTATVAGISFPLSGGSGISGRVLAPAGLSISRAMSVDLVDARGISVSSVSAVFNSSSAASYAFAQLPDGDYTLSLRDASYPRVYAAAPRRVHLAGADATGQDLQSAPAGIIKCRVAVTQTLSGGGSQSRVITSANLALLPPSFSIRAVSDPWFPGGLGLASGPGGGPPALDDGGEFVIDGLPAGTYDVKFAGPGAAVIPGVSVTAGNVTDLGYVSLGAGAGLSGAVTDASTGLPLANIRVHAAPSVRGAGVAARSADALTDGSGRYVLSGLDPAVRFYDVTAAYRGVETQGESLPPYQQTISAGADLSAVSTLDFGLAPAAYSVSGRVAAPAGGPALGVPAADGSFTPGAWIYLQKLGVIPTGNPIADVQMRTDFDGRFTVPSLTTGTYRLIAASMGYASLTRVLSITTASVDAGTLTMAQGSVLTGALSNPDGSSPAQSQAAQILAVTPDMTGVLVGTLTADPSAQTVTGYSISGFVTGASYRVIVLDALGGITAPSEAASVVFRSSGTTTLDLVLRGAAPLTAATAARSGAGFQLEFAMSQPLRRKTPADDDLSSILTPVSAAGTLSALTLSRDRTRLQAFYAPGVSESSFTFHLRGYSAATDPSSVDPVNPQFLSESTVTFFAGLDALGQTHVANLSGGSVLAQGDKGRVTLPPGAFSVGASSSVLVTLQVAGEPLTSASAAGLPAAAGRLKSLRYGPRAYPPELLAAAAAVPPSVNPLSAFYNIFLPLGVNANLSKPAQLTVQYSAGTDPSLLNLYWFNPAAGVYVLQQDVTGAAPVIDLSARTFTVNVGHFSTYVLFNSAQAVISGGGGAQSLQADNFPNPFDLGAKTVTPLHAGGACSPNCTINGTMIGISVPPDLTGSATIRIFGVTGTLVRTIDVGAVSGGNYYYQNWDGTNDAGRPVASGAYIGELKIGQRTTFFKMAIIKGSGL